MFFIKKKNKNILFLLISLVDIFDPYVPAEGDGKTSYLSTEVIDLLRIFF